MSNHYPLVIVGGGPAGLAALNSADSDKVLLIDESPTLGGQIWRGQYTSTDFPKAEVWQGISISMAHERSLQCTNGLCASWDKLILCTGAREMFLPFPGWTDPRVIGAGGLQALIKSGFSVENKNVVVCGSGPLLLAVASLTAEKGAKVIAVTEQASVPHLLPFLFQLLTKPQKLKQGLEYKSQLKGTKLLYGTWPTSFNDGELELSNGQTLKTDIVACGYGLIPNIELAKHLGCQTRFGRVEVNEAGETSVDGIFAAGEVTGVGGADLSSLEGEIAGLAATGQKYEHLLRKKAGERSFADSIEHAFSLRPELKQLVDDETVVCRCEDVKWEQLKEANSFKEAKLYSRCGMGACQARICGPACSFLKGWEVTSIRPPIVPATTDELGLGD